MSWKFLPSPPPEEEVYDSDDPPKKNDAGRPKGTTQAKKRSEADSIRSCMDAITSVMVNETAGKKAKGMRVEKGFLDRLIKEKKKEFGVVSDISKKTIQNRVSRGIVFAHHLYYLLLHMNLFSFLDKKEERRVFIWGICFSLHLIE